ncbi:aldehyde-activating protein [Pseudomonas sp. NDM]|uniref:GFA family protein n=1 Tax=Pseudomonas sp. NDM TaxID=2170733 RepID=UPI000D5D2E66|nr:GFA family protein [Pseudomonas sp. NDM]PWB31679.1 aldehyde-activating protein [Pseudomonas sp. NDM]
METNHAHNGGCHCGHIRYQFSGPLRDIAHCHCSICRKVSGGIVTTWITVPAANFRWLAGTPARYDSSASCARFFCANCGAQLALVTSLSPESIDVTIATLDHPQTAPAERHIWTDSRLPWLHLDEHLPGEAEETLD